MTRRDSGVVAVQFACIEGKFDRRVGQLVLSLGTSRNCCCWGLGEVLVECWRVVKLSGEGLFERQLLWNDCFSFILCSISWSFLSMTAWRRHFSMLIAIHSRLRISSGWVSHHFRTWRFNLRFLPRSSMSQELSFDGKIFNKWSILMSFKYFGLRFSMTSPSSWRRIFSKWGKGAATPIQSAQSPLLRIAWWKTRRAWSMAVHLASWMSCKTLPNMAGVHSSFDFSKSSWARSKWPSLWA